MSLFELCQPADVCETIEADDIGHTVLRIPTSIDKYGTSACRFACSCKSLQNLTEEFKFDISQFVSFVDMRWSIHDVSWYNSEIHCSHIVQAIHSTRACYVYRVFIALGEHKTENEQNYINRFRSHKYCRNQIKMCAKLAQLNDPPTWADVSFNQPYGSYTFPFTAKEKKSFPTHYTVKFDKYNWTCTCSWFSRNNNCRHIYTVKEREERIQNRREMCISFATLCV